MYCVNELHCIFIIKNKETDKETDKEREREIFQFGPTWGRKNEVRMEKVLQGVTPLL